MNTNSFAPVNNTGLFNEIASTLSKYFSNVDVDDDYQIITSTEVNADDEIVHSVSIAFKKTALNIGNNNIIVPVIIITDEFVNSSVKKFTDLVTDVAINKVFMRRLNSCCIQIIYGCNENSNSDNVISKVIKKALDLMVIDNVADNN